MINLFVSISVPGMMRTSLFGASSTPLPPRVITFEGTPPTTINVRFMIWFVLRVQHTHELFSALCTFDSSLCLLRGYASCATHVTYACCQGKIDDSFALPGDCASMLHFTPNLPYTQTARRALSHHMLGASMISWEMIASLAEGSGI